jgi:hypothetical protein
LQIQHDHQQDEGKRQQLAESDASIPVQPGPFVSRTLTIVPPLIKPSGVTILPLPPLASVTVTIVITIVMVMLIMPRMAAVVITVVIIETAAGGC